MLGLLGDVHRLVRSDGGLGEPTQLNEAPNEVDPRQHRRHRRLAQPVAAEMAS